MKRLFMKKWYLFLCLFILTSSASYGQNVYPNFTELNGMEDYNGNTNLLYRIYSSEQDMYNNNTGYNVYLFNLVNKVDTVFQLDYSYYNEYTGGGWRSVDGYDFWEKNPRKFIVSGSHGSDDGSPFVERFDKVHIIVPFFGAGGFIGISRQNDSLVFATFNNGLLYRSTDGGIIWDTISDFNVCSLSPYNDKVLFSSENGVLYKTTDGGFTKHAVDTIPASGYLDFLYYDKDTNYIYRTSYYYSQDQGVYKLSVSNKSGEAYSWQVKLTSASQIYLSVDNTVTGSVFLATGRYIYHSTDFGNTFSLIQTFDRSLVGIYKKPGSSKLYAATYNTIYEIDGSYISIIKQIPIDKEIFKFDPLDIGNKWYYKTNQSAKGVLYKEVVKDTILANQKTFRQIKQQLIDSLYYQYVSYSYERIDSLTGDVYGWGTDSTEYIMDNLNHNPGDTINASRFLPYLLTVFDSLKTITLFGLPIETRVYSVNDFFDDAHYYLSKGFGMSYLLKGDNIVLIINELKGAVIKGVVYGDTSTVVGIVDKYTDQPKEFVLSQNYPNPFNPTTTINYSIPKAGQVKLTIYNAIGSKVATIVNEYKQVGNYSVQFNSSNHASGIYFYKLESGQFLQIKKMILLK
jgi:hypothetical protein